MSIGRHCCHENLYFRNNVELQPFKSGHSKGFFNRNIYTHIIWKYYEVFRWVSTCEIKRATTTSMENVSTNYVLKMGYSGSYICKYR